MKVYLKKHGIRYYAEIIFEQIYDDDIVIKIRTWIHDNLSSYDIGAITHDLEAGNGMTLITYIFNESDAFLFKLAWGDIIS